jgi:hypothetical protein
LPRRRGLIESFVSAGRSRALVQAGAVHASGSFAVTILLYKKRREYGMNIYVYGLDLSPMNIERWILNLER